MALIVDIPLAGGVVAKNCYVRVRELRPMKRRLKVINEEQEPYWFAIAHFVAYGSKEESLKCHPDGVPSGETLHAPALSYLQVRVESETNVITTVYEELKNDLSKRGIQWREEEE
mgnify:CR=1 FL=1|jgi:hypothetical protein